MAEPALAPAFSRLVLFDGVCVFCDGAMRWLMAHDPEGRLRFAMLQGATAAELRARHPEIPEDIDTMVFVDATQGSERVYLRSQAIFRALAEVGASGFWVSLLSKLPRPLADFGYGIFVRIRYRAFGRFDTCRVPTPEERERFLD